MLDDSSNPGHTLCVFCRMEARPTIWSVIDNIIPTDNYDEANENFTTTDEPIDYHDESGAVVERTLDEDNSADGMH